MSDLTQMSLDNGTDFPDGAGRDNAPFMEGAFIPTKVGYTIAAGASTICEIAIEVQDGHETAIASGIPFNVWLSDAATGVGLTAVTASGTVTVKTASGAVFGTLTAKKALVVQPLATGIFTLEITDSARTGFYIAVQLPGSGQVSVSRVLVTADYGA